MCFFQKITCECSKCILASVHGRGFCIQVCFNVQENWSSLKCICNWKGPCKPAPSGDFVGIFQVAQNPLKFAMPTLFLWKNVPVFHKRENKAPNTFLKAPSPSPSNCLKHTCTVFWLSRIELLRCLETDRGRGGGGVFSPQFCLYVSASLKKGHFSTARSRHGKFQRILSNLENRH